MITLNYMERAVEAMRIFKRQHKSTVLSAKIEALYAQTARLTDLAGEQHESVERTAKQLNNLSLQIEEIYDLVKDSASVEAQLQSAVRREAEFVSVVAEMTDMTDDLTAYLDTQPTLAETGAAVRANTAALLERVGVFRVGEVGEILNPKLHTVVETADLGQPFESVVRILRSGFARNGKVIRKAHVIVNR